MADNAGTPFDTGGKKKARIEIIPLIDVIFFLLATFVLFTLSLNKIQSMEAKLPVPSDKQDTEQNPPLVVQVSSGDTVFIAQETSAMSEVFPRLVQYKQSQDQGGKIPRVLITGDDGAKYGSLIKVLDYAKSAGIDQISVETAYRAQGR